MPQIHEAAILGTGSYVPEKVLANAELSKMVNTSDEWIVSRTGIHERRIAAPEQATSDLGIEAGRKAIQAAGLCAEDIDLVVCATISGDHAFPATACIIQDKLGIGKVGAFDLSAACSGFVFGLSVAHQFIAAGAAKYVLLVGSEVLSRIVDYTDRSSCILFGDGAGAVVVGRSDGNSGCILHHLMGSDGSGANLLIVPGGGSRKPLTKDNIGDRLQYIKLGGREVFKFAVQIMIRCCRETTAGAGVSLNEVQHIIPHQVNYRIIQAASERLDYPMSQIHQNIQKYGNTSSASVPIALDEAVRADRIAPGDLVLLVGFGGGLTWGGNLVRW